MKRLLLGILVFCFIGISSVQAQVMSDYCSTPPFINTVLKPNILVILDNSNSMDEDFYGNAAGSFNSTDKLVIGKKALRDIITRFKDKLRLGVASFKIGSGVSALYIHNSPYFASYQVKSYCPNPPPECVDWCQTNNTGSKATCTTACQAQNAAFDPDYFDEIITANGVGSPTRNKYCGLLYPKTNVEVPDPINYPGISLYYKQALPFYDNPQPTAHCYSPGYSTQECGGTSVGPWNDYSCWAQKTDSSDVGTGYNGTNIYNGGLLPTDSDVAAGYLNFGRRLSWYPVGPTWFKNSSDGDGYMHVNVDDLVDTGGSDTTTFTNVMAKLDPKEGDQTGYMSCGNSDKDSCPYIIAAGLTPTAGTFQTAINYFQGVSSPIQYGCQTNYVIFVTDGLPSVNESGGVDTANNLMPGVISKISALRAATKTLGSTNYTFDIKSYILGVGLTPDAKLKLDSMAVAGGTEDTGGHAYYADNPTAMSNALTQIFEDIARRVSSGTAASVLASSEGSGANIAQAIFYPKRLSSTSDVVWTGALNNLWYYVDPFFQNSSIRENNDVDTATLKYLNLKKDYEIRYFVDPADANTKVKLYEDANGDGIGEVYQGTILLDEMIPIWEAGNLLWSRSDITDPRVINTSNSSNGFVPFESDVATATTLRTSLQAGSLTEAQNIINYVRGNEITGYRNRSVQIGASTNVWKLGDIISSTPRVQSTVPLNSYHMYAPSGYQDSTYAAFIQDSAYQSRGMVYAGANDGMLHAFNLGVFSEAPPSSTTTVAQLAGTNMGKEVWAYLPRNVLPYLKYLKDPDYCHLYYVNNPTTLFDASVYKDLSSWTSKSQAPATTRTKDSWRTILIGAMGLGGACKDKDSPSNTNCPCASGGSCTDAVLTPIGSSTTGFATSNGLGYSTYFALDVTTPGSPQLLWELASPCLGYATSGPAIVKVASDTTSNGKWYAIFASGPTGKVDSTWKQFTGVSDQNLIIFVVDLLSGTIVYQYDTGIAKAFAGSLRNSTFDAERSDGQAVTGRYSDDVVYVPYSNWDTTVSTAPKWNGGVLRITVDAANANDPSKWKYSTLINDVGPITTGIAKLQDRRKGKFWIYFGTGRFFYKRGSDIDDAVDQRALYGIKEPCYQSNNTIGTSCVSSVPATSITDVSTTPVTSVTSGWKIKLDLSGNDTIPTESGFLTVPVKAERLVASPIASSNGVVFFTTLKPSADFCSQGGNSYLWASWYETGGPPPNSSLLGQAIIQVSSGSINLVNLKGAGWAPRGTGSQSSSPVSTFVSRGIAGDGFSVQSAPTPLRRILHIKEK